MKHKMNILVTGCGGDIGQSIGKILNECAFINQLYGCDISSKNAAKFIYPNFFLGLPISDDKYLIKLEENVNEKDLDLVIPVSEPELRFFSKKKLKHVGKAKLLIASEEALVIGFDKQKTADFLKKENLPFPKTTLIKETDSIDSWPIIVKSKTGSGSSNVHVINDLESFEFFKKNHPDFIVQEYLSDNNGEFTCGVFRSKNGIIRTIILKRELTGGYTGYGEVVGDEEIDFILHEIAKRIFLIGSINIQLRVTSKGPVVFEINPRFSSTVLFRHLFGFKDLEWSIEDKFDLALSPYTNSAIGKKFFKGWSEYIL